ncbi:hypothetical protein [Halalkalibacter lacteus]|uniref:hypothetical protein n=1 Tax=Halalkalibacter lacteus TaxID=3090663 RepID=UPI002FC8DFD8
MKEILFSWQSQHNIENPWALPTLFGILALLLSMITWVRQKKMGKHFNSKYLKNKK